MAMQNGNGQNERSLPDGWDWTTLGESCDVTLGQSPSSDTYNTDGIGLPFFQGKAEFGDLYPTIAKWCSKPKKIAEAEDILISVRAPVGPTNLCRVKSCIGRGLAALRPRDGMPVKYFLYFLQFIEKEWDAKATGTTFKAISGSTLRNQQIPLPPLPEQERIVARIEELFTQLEAGTSALKRAQTALKRYKASVLKAAVSGELVNGKLGIGEGELPEGWRWVKIRDVGEIVTGTTPSKAQSEYYSDEYPFYKPTDLDAGFNTREARDGLSSQGIHKARLLPPMSVLVTCIGATIGKTGLIRVAGASNQQINAIIPNDTVVPEYLYFVCNSPQFQKFIQDNASATTLPILNKGRFEELLLPLPSLEEQRRIVAEVERRLESARAVEAAVEAGLKRAGRLRQAVLRSAFEGGLG